MLAMLIQSDKAGFYMAGGAILSAFIVPLLYITFAKDEEE